MEIMRFTILSLLACFLTGVSCLEEAGPRTPPQEHPSNFKTPPYFGLGSKGPEDFSKYFDKTYDYKESGGWPGYPGGPIPSSLGASVSWGPFIPLGMPLPQSFFSPYGPGPIDGYPTPGNPTPFDWSLSSEGKDYVDPAANGGGVPEEKESSEERKGSSK